jgi:hypothetical protein
MNEKISNEMMDDIFSDIRDDVMGIRITIERPDEMLEQAMRNIGRHIKAVDSRPSNHHGSNPKRKR